MLVFVRECIDHCIVLLIACLGLCIHAAFRQEPELKKQKTEAPPVVHRFCLLHATL